jgi:predicted GNAT family acetyltransferase
LSFIRLFQMAKPMAAAMAAIMIRTKKIGISYSNSVSFSHTCVDNDNRGSGLGGTGEAKLTRESRSAGWAVPTISIALCQWTGRAHHSDWWQD